MEYCCPTNLHINRIPLIKCPDNWTDQRWLLIKNIFHFRRHVAVSMMETVQRLLQKSEVIKISKHTGKECSCYLAYNKGKKESKVHVSSVNLQ